MLIQVNLKHCGSFPSLDYEHDSDVGQLDKLNLKNPFTFSWKAPGSFQDLISTLPEVACRETVCQMTVDIDRVKTLYL